MKKFIITVDTEGDALWASEIHAAPTTGNASCIPRFQQLCEKYGFQPVYLINYEMIEDQALTQYLSGKAAEGLCEIGMHMHAWNSPPEFPLIASSNEKRGLPYVTEYPLDVMEEKIRFLTDLIQERTGVRPVSHRAGRWSTNEEYLKLLAKLGYQADSSVTPHVNWNALPGYTEHSRGSDYSGFPETPYVLSEDKESRLWEVPMTIADSMRYIQWPARFNAAQIRSSLRIALKGEHTWMRIMKNDIQGQLCCLKRNRADYAMFMLHSSELLPGNSPYFPTVEATERFWKNMDYLFQKAAEEYEGITLQNYVRLLELRAE